MQVRGSVEGEGVPGLGEVTVYPGYFIDIDIAMDVGNYTWELGDVIGYQITATDEDGSEIPDEYLTFKVSLQHCFFPRCMGGTWDCHEHVIAKPVPATRRGSVIGPEHDYPHYLDFTAIYDHPVAQGFSSSRTYQLYPRERTLVVTSSPPGVVVHASDVLSRRTPAEFQYAGSNLANIQTVGL